MAFNTGVSVIVEYIIILYIIHSDIPSYTKLAFNSLKMIRNDTVSQPIKQGIIGL